MNQNGGIHKGGFAVLCHRNGGSESPGILIFLVIVRCITIERVLGEVIFTGQKRAHTTELEDALAAIQNGKLVHTHKLFATMSSDELKKQHRTN